MALLKVLCEFISVDNTRKALVLKNEETSEFEVSMIKFSKDGMSGSSTSRKFACRRTAEESAEDWIAIL